MSIPLKFAGQKSARSGRQNGMWKTDRQHLGLENYRLSGWEGALHGDGQWAELSPYPDNAPGTCQNSNRNMNSR
jgi:hypothetical protein